MNAGAEFRGVEELLARLRGMVAKMTDVADAAVVVGYTASYALFVHENVEMKWKGFSRDPRIRRIEMGGDPARARPRPRRREPHGKFWDPQDKGTAKFLERPAEELRAGGEFARIIVEALAARKTLPQALLACGLRLQRESQKLVPIDSGNLRASAFTRLEVSGAPAGGGGEDHV